MKKKLVTLLLACACVVGTLGVVACKDKDANKYPSNAIENGLKFEYYGVNNDEGYRVSPAPDETETLTDVVIPAEYKGYPVISAEFTDCDSLTSIIIPDGVLQVDFRDCDSLTSITIPDSVNWIVSGAFAGCDSLTSVTLGSGETEIGMATFRDCKALTSIIIPDSVTEIFSNAFVGCYSLTDVTIGSSVTEIGSACFDGCTSLSNITISDSVTQIGVSAFSGCDSLEKVNYTGTIDEWARIQFNGINSNPLQYAKKLYINDVEVTEVKLTTATKISSNAFRDCDSLTSVVIPDSVTSIGDMAFSGCSGLTGDLIIPDSVTSIGELAFEGTNFTNIVIGNGVTSIGWEAFSGSSLTVYYAGTEAQWNSIAIANNNNALKSATIYYNGETHRCNHETKTDESYHWTECSCGAATEKIAHSYEKKTDGSYHWTECSCGKATVKLLHNYVSKKDDTYHWTQCTCGQATEKIVHSYEKKTDGSYHWTECSCGKATVKLLHNYVSKKDDTHHWTECECGKATAKIAHNYQEKTDSSYHWTECSCGKATEKIAHTFGEWQKNEETHWKDCSCGYSTEKVAHTYGGDNVCDDCGYARAVYQRVDAQGNVSATGSYILFGSYPQSKVTDTALTNALSASAGDLPAYGSNEKWTSYKYYISGSNTLDYMWYQDVTYSGEKYRGVYFSSYRPEYTDYESSADKSYQDDNGYSVSTMYWFRYEPIKWKILEEESGYATVLCEMVIDSQDYYPVDGSRTVDGQTVYSTNYEYSYIREWLNETFYQTAFGELEQALIQTITVDNSAESTGETTNDYACADTQDKVWLLSYKEATTYFSNEEDRAKVTTDYAQCQGALSSSDDKGDGWRTWGYWWLRSPIKDAYIGGYFMGYTIHVVDDYGTLGMPGYANDTARAGVCPALKIKLN